MTNRNSNGNRLNHATEEVDTAMSRYEAIKLMFKLHKDGKKYKNWYTQLRRAHNAELR